MNSPWTSRRSYSSPRLLLALSGVGLVGVALIIPFGVLRAEKSSPSLSMFRASSVSARRAQRQRSRPATSFGTRTFSGVGACPVLISYQSPSAGTVVATGSAVSITYVEPPRLGIDPPPSSATPITVTSRMASSVCSSSEGPGVHVVAAYRISSAQLKMPPISDRGPLSRQSSSAVWKMCYVVGPHVAVSYGLGPSHADYAVWIFYRSGSLAEVGASESPYRFVVSSG